MHKILTYNNISATSLDRLPNNQYEVSSEIQYPDAILLRSFNLHGIPIPGSVKCVGRAGVGVDNIPVSEFSKRGIPVFNAPGANANAVKELTLAGLLLAARHISPALDFVRTLRGDDQAINQAVEKGKKQFAGFELAGKTLGVIGLGAIGVKVANAALGLGMKVMGFDPSLTVQSAWQLSSQVAQASSVDDLLTKSDFVTLHVPLVEQTHHFINSARIGLMKNTAVLLNFSRGGVVEAAAVLDALEEGKLRAYVCDFPDSALLNRKGVIALPHIGASTEEAEENCAVMVVDQIRDYLENGNIRNAVNFPDVVVPRTEGCRLGIANENIPGMVSQISSALADANLNIADLVNQSRGEYAYTLIDVNAEVPSATLERIRSIPGVLSARIIWAAAIAH